jgi:hypothetical protein
LPHTERTAVGLAMRRTLVEAVPLLAGAATSFWINLASSAGAGTIAIIGLAVTIALEIVVRVLVERLSSPSFDRNGELLERARLSQVRSEQMWKALQLPDETIIKLGNVYEEFLPNIPEYRRGITCLSGELGLGKSTYAEYHFRRCVEIACADVDAPWPIFIEARDLAGRKLNDVAEADCEKTAKRFTVILDGLDEVDRDSARILVSDAERFIKYYPGSDVIILTRPGYLEGVKEVEIPKLGRDLAERLVSISAGREIESYMLHPEERELILRPLFALMIGSQVGGHFRHSLTQAGILATLVERTIIRDSHPREETFSVLRKFAAMSTSSNGRVHRRELGSLVERERLIATRLVVERNELLRFTNIVFEQYFAGQALLFQEADISKQLASPGAWEPWRFAWMMAVATGSWNQTYPLMSLLIKRYPGAATWLIKMAVPKHAITGAAASAAGSMPDDSDLTDRLTKSSRLLINFSGNLRHSLGPGVGADDFGVLGHSDKDWVSIVAWKNSVPSEFRLPHPTKGPFDPNTWLYLGWHASDHPSWAWQIAVQLLKNRIDVLLTKLSHIPGVPALQHEQLWYVIKAISSRKLRAEMHDQPSLRPFFDQIKKRFEDLLDHGQKNHVVSYRFDRLGPFTLADLETTAALLDDPSLVDAPPWPFPDLRPTNAQWMSDSYSDDQLAARANSVYLAALDGYQQMVDLWFPGIGKTMGLRMMQPVVIDGSIERHDGIPGASFTIRPSAARANTCRLASPGSKLDLNWDSELWDDMGNELRLCRPGARPWVTGQATTSSLFLFGDLPATEIAIRWIKRELQRLGIE